MVLHLGIFAKMEHQRQHKGHDLPDHRRPGSSRHAHLRQSQKTIDHDRIQHDVGNCPRDLCDRGIQRISGCLQQLFIYGKEHDPHRHHAADPQVGDRHGSRQSVLRLAGDIRLCSKQSKQQKDHVDHHPQKNTVACCLRDLLPLALSKTHRQDRTHSHAGSDGNRHHQHLHRKRQRKRVERDLPILLHTADKGAVHNIVRRLQHHRQHHRNSHGKHQLRHRHDCHLIGCFFWMFLRFHMLLLFCTTQRGVNPSGFTPLVLLDSLYLIRFFLEKSMVFCIRLFIVRDSSLLHSRGSPNSPPASGSPGYTLPRSR